eukprot:12444890-Alexandrium_andersonii.AAC.1
MPDQRGRPGNLDAERVPLAQILRAVCGALAGRPRLLAGPLLINDDQREAAGEPLGHSDTAALARLLGGDGSDLAARGNAVVN